MKKSLIALAALGAFASGAMAQSYVTVYGIVDLGLVKQNRADAGSALGAGIGLQTKELSVNQSARSRLGFKGMEDLGGGYQAKFKLEHRLSPDTGLTTGTTASVTPSFWDMSVVSLVTPFGEIGMGRDYMPAFYLQYQLDPWINQGIAMIGGSSYPFAAYTSATRGTRINNGVFYTIAANGITGMVAASLNETAVGSDRYGLAVQYAAGPLFLGMAYDQADEAGNATTDHNLLMIGGAYDFGWIKPRLSFAKTDKGATSPFSYTLAATAPLGTGFVKFGASKLDLDDGTASKSSTKSGKVSLGYEYTMSKRTALYTDITYGKTSGTPSVTGFDAGIRHMF
jgi:predicted porin